MKKTFILSITFLFALFASSQTEFKKELAVARTAYAAGKLDDSRTAMQQMLYDLDMITGKEVLKLLPLKMGDKSANTKADNVTSASGFLGVIIHREWASEKKEEGSENKNINLDIISNSPLITSINALLSVPFVGNAGGNKVVKINGYKALITKVETGNDKEDYDLQMPLNNCLITLKAPGVKQDDIIKYANSLPIPDIAKMLQ
jgi:hypothetical protein